uniref:Uncharacterized protein n=1 Tax=Oryza meridionalis TaxID=40149 RepID=A0A0E0EPH7_9ORYZ
MLPLSRAAGVRRCRTAVMRVRRSRGMEVRHCLGPTSPLCGGGACNDFAWTDVGVESSAFQLRKLPAFLPDGLLASSQTSD